MPEHKDEPKISIFSSDGGDSGKGPVRTGKIEIGISHLKKMVERTKENGGTCQFRVALWSYQGKTCGEYHFGHVELDEWKSEKGDQNAPAEDDDIPF